ncbi:MAG: hypothetical protein PVJ86_05920 [Phycisphaerales bacterium]|jgi:hypothetical protein
MRITFEDLTYEAQARLLSDAGVSSPAEMRWDIFPVAVVDFDGKGHALGEKNFGDDICDEDIP